MGLFISNKFIIKFFIHLLLTKIIELESRDTAPLKDLHSTLCMQHDHYQNLTQAQSSLYLYTTSNSLLNCTFVQTVAAFKYP